MAKHFSDKTFKYFELAQKNKNNEKWFEKNKDLYLENVREPFESLRERIRREFGSELPRVDTLKNISKPLRPKNRVDKNNALIKRTSYLTLWEKQTSRFEWNPGIHIQFGPEPDDNFLGAGLYNPSSRQMSLLRNALVEDFEEIDDMLTAPKFKKTWGKIQGDVYKRFPKGFDAENPKSLYLWHKQFYVGKELSRTQVKSKTFADKVVADLEVALPFFQWVRGHVGVYRGSSSFRT